MANLKQIEKYLKSQNLHHKVIDLGEDLPAGKAGIYTVEGVKKVGINPKEIVKTLIVRINTDDFAALALRGKDRVDFKKVRRLFGSKSELAKPEEVLKVAGVPIGAVCPILLKIPIHVDCKVMELENVHIGSGDPKKGLEMKLGDLLKVVGDYRLENFA